MVRNKWSKAFWVDFLERVGATFVGALITLVTMDNILEGPDWNTVLWPIVVVPTLLAVLKGLLANVKDPESGASLLNHPPGPEVQE
jgi:hypothetical protein